ncbi:immunoglobulin superfamily member 10, partial [Corchorus capsularis]
LFYDEFFTHSQPKLFTTSSNVQRFYQRSSIEIIGLPYRKTNQSRRNVFNRIPFFGWQARSILSLNQMEKRGAASPTTTSFAESVYETTCFNEGSTSMKRLISPSSGGGTTGGFRGEHRTEGSLVRLKMSEKAIHEATAFFPIPQTKVERSSQVNELGAHTGVSNYVEGIRFSQPLAEGGKLTSGSTLGQTDTRSKARHLRPLRLTVRHLIRFATLRFYLRKVQDS